MRCLGFVCQLSCGYDVSPCSQSRTVRGSYLKKFLCFGDFDHLCVGAVENSVRDSLRCRIFRLGVPEAIAVSFPGLSCRIYRVVSSISIHY